MLRWLMFLAVLLYATVPLATADQYWVAWEGDDFPENEGWERTISDGGAQRSLDAGTLVLDSLHSVTIVDFYTIERTINPDPGELFVLEWSLRVEEI
jgi:hypothetical protein